MNEELTKAFQVAGSIKVLLAQLRSLSLACDLDDEADRSLLCATSEINAWLWFARDRAALKQVVND